MSSYILMTFLYLAKLKKEHDVALEMVLERTRQAGLKFNKNKTKLYEKEIKFMGHQFTEEGQKPDIEKISAIVNMAKPQSVTDLQRFLGMVNYLGTYIRNLASNTSNLRELLKKDILWIYIYGQRIVVETDHRPLVPLF